MEFRGPAVRTSDRAIVFLFAYMGILIFHVSCSSMPLHLDQMGAERRTDGAGCATGRIEQKREGGFFAFGSNVAHAVPNLHRR